MRDPKESNRWRILPQTHLIESGDDWVLFHRLGQRILLRTRAADAVRRAFAFLQEPRSFQEIKRSFFASEDDAVVRSFLEGLRRHSLASEVPEDEVPAVDPRWRWKGFAEGLGVPEAGLRRIHDDIVRVGLSVAALVPPPEGFLAAWRPVATADPRTQGFPDKTRFHILILSSGDHESLEALAEPALGTAVLPVLLDPFGAMIGPICEGRAGRPCLSCLSKRLRSTLNRQQYLESVPPEVLSRVTESWAPGFWGRLESILDEELFKIHGGLVYSPLHRGALILDFLNHRCAQEDVFPVPGCFCSGSRFPATERDDLKDGP